MQFVHPKWQKMLPLASSRPTTSTLSTVEQLNEITSANRRVSPAVLPTHTGQKTDGYMAGMSHCNPESTCIPRRTSGCWCSAASSSIHPPIDRIPYRILCCRTSECDMYSFRMCNFIGILVLPFAILAVDGTIQDTSTEHTTNNI